MNRTVSLLAASTVLLLVKMPASAVTIDTVPVGNAGNPGDTVVMHDGTSGYGAVNYSYRIGTYEVTNSQYAAFLNAVASHTDPYDLYSVFMEFGSRGGIKPVFSAGTVNYATKPGMGNMPVNYVSWGSAARFANWLHNGQPTGAQGPGTTEDGAYTLNGAMTDSALMAVSRNADARWFVPTENEWYKAAYYQPAAKGGDSDSYWWFPMRTNSVPYSDQPPGATPDNTRVGNFQKYDASSPGYDDGYAVTGQLGGCIIQNCLTDVGAYTLSPSFYRTFDQGGNVEEWNETAMSSSTRVQRGGMWIDNYLQLHVSNREGRVPTEKNNYIGFRVATVIPEPSSAVLAASIFALLACRRSRG